MPATTKAAKVKRAQDITAARDAILAAEAAMNTLAETVDLFESYADLTGTTDALIDAWNGLHDLARILTDQAAEAEIDVFMHGKHIDPNTAALVAANID